MSCSDNIALSRKQRVFAVVETTCGSLQFPSGSTDFVRPAGNAIINQAITFVDSEELSDTLDVLDQFQNATGAATWSVPMYLRPSGTVGSAPQGAAFFRSMQGSLRGATTASLNGAVSSSATTLVIDGISGGDFPEVGVITIGSETIHYTSLTMTHGGTTATLSGCTRGYNSTTATSAADNASVSLGGIFYEQDTSSPSFSLWVETDHFVQGLSGATVNNCAIGVNNEGAVTLSLSGEGMQMVWAGSSTLSTSQTAGNSTITVADGEIFAAGAYIQNYTQSHNNSSSGYEISSISGNVLTLGTVLEGNWAKDDVIKGYLPPETVIGTPVESKDTTVEIDSVATSVRGTDITISVPKNYLVDEIGTSYPEDFLEDKRDISGTLNLYFRKADAQYFQQGMSGTTKSLLITFGDTAGYIMDMYLKKAQIHVPELSVDGSAMQIAIGFKALGTNGEDSLQIVLR